MSRSRALLLVVAFALAVALGAAVLAACGAAGGASSTSPAADPVVLHVDGRAIHQSAVDAVRAEYRLGGTTDTEARAEKEVVRRELVRREAERLGVAADPAEVASRRSAMVAQLGGEQALAAALAKVPMTAAQLRSGLTDGVLREALQDAKFKDLVTSVAAARAYYDGHRAAFRVQASAHVWAIQVAAERIAESALGRLRQGHPFAEVARQFSTDPEAKAQGGDMGTVALSSLPAPLSRALETAPAGRVTRPVQGPGGWYLLKATGLTRAHTVPFSKAEKDIVKELTRRKRFAALEAWLNGARDKASVTRP
jgi:parvulin-like peptidyl-prolyl isomerase